VVIRASAQTHAEAGQQLTAGFDARSMHWFDAKTTLRME
jgi:sn-glycerol 3-phosphate transport system ATP-binding protein